MLLLYRITHLVCCWCVSEMNSHLFGLFWKRHSSGKAIAEEQLIFSFEHLFIRWVIANGEPSWLCWKTTVTLSPWWVAMQPYYVFVICCLKILYIVFYLGCHFNFLRNNLLTFHCLLVYFKNWWAHHRTWIEISSVLLKQTSYSPC